MDAAGTKPKNMPDAMSGDCATSAAPKNAAAHMITLYILVFAVLPKGLPPSPRAAVHASKPVIAVGFRRAVLVGGQRHVVLGLLLIRERCIPLLLLVPVEDEELVLCGA